MLLQTPLKAANGQIYAVGQGPVSTGGFSAGGGGNSQSKNFPTVGMTPNGGIVERDVASQLAVDGTAPQLISLKPTRFYNSESD